MLLLLLGEPEVTVITPTLLIAGQTATLTCSTLYNYPPASFNWTQGDNNTPLDPTRFTISTNGNLLISPVIPDDHQTITCHANNIHGSSLVSQFISVDVIPVVQFSNSSVNVFLNSNLMVTCSAFSRPLAILEVFVPSGNKALSFQVSSVVSERVWLCGTMCSYDPLILYVGTPLGHYPQ